MSKIKFLSILYFLSILIFCYNVFIGIWAYNKFMVFDDVILSGYWLVLGFYSGIWGCILLRSKMYEWIEIEEKEEVNQ